MSIQYTATRGIRTHDFSNMTFRPKIRHCHSAIQDKVLFLHQFFICYRQLVRRGLFLVFHADRIDRHIVVRIFVGRRRSGFLSFSFFLLSSSSLFFDHSLSQGQDTARVQYPDDDQAGGCDDQVEGRRRYLDAHVGEECFR